MISVIIPAYNSSEYLERALKSVLRQRCSDLEIILVNDGSTDRTHAMILPYLERREIRYLYQKNQGVSAARNFGAMHARGDYLMFLDADDYWHEDLIKIMKPFIKKGYDWLCFDELRVYCEGQKVLYKEKSRKFFTRGTLREKIIQDNVVGNPCRLVIQKDFFKTILFDETLCMHEDWDLWMRIVKASLNYRHIRLPLTHYTKQVSQLVKRTDLHHRLSFLKFIDKHWSVIVNSGKTTRMIYADHLWDLGRRILYENKNPFFCFLCLIRSQYLHFNPEAILRAVGVTATLTTNRRPHAVKTKAAAR